MNDKPNMTRLNADMVRNVVSAAIENFDVTNLRDDQSFASAGLDSLDEVTILIELEDRFGLSVEEVDADKCSSIAGIVEYFRSEALQRTGTSDS